MITCKRTTKSRVLLFLAFCLIYHFTFFLFIYIMRSHLVIGGVPRAGPHVGPAGAILIPGHLGGHPFGVLGGGPFGGGPRFGFVVGAPAAPAAPPAAVGGHPNGCLCPGGHGIPMMSGPRCRNGCLRLAYRGDSRNACCKACRNTNGYKCDCDTSAIPAGMVRIAGGRVRCRYGHIKAAYHGDWRNACCKACRDTNGQRCTCP